MHAAYFNWGILLVAGCALFLLLGALIIAITVARASQRPIPGMQAVKSGLSILAWVIPAVAVVGYVGLRSGELFHEAPRAVALLPASMTASLPAAPITKTRLSARSTVAEPPEWSKTAQEQPAPPESERVISSGKFASLEEAEQDVTNKALQLLDSRFREELKSDARLTVDLIDRYAVNDLVVERFEKQFDLTDGRQLSAPMYVAHLKLELAPGLRDAVYANWASELVNRRITTLGGMTALVTLMLGTAAVYFRLNEATGGAHQRRLKFAAAFVLGAVSLLALALV
jgi:hypothetical protein